jgi:cardiolipin synthase
MSAGEAVNLPNSLTLLRILLVPVFVVLLLKGHFDQALGVLLLAGITDGLDGTIARFAKQQTLLGAYLDPFADKLLMTSGFLTLGALELVPRWVVALVVCRDVLLLSATIWAKCTGARCNIEPTVMGKASTLLQVCYLFAAVYLASRGADLQLLAPLLYAMLACNLLSGCHYLYRGLAAQFHRE